MTVLFYICLGFMLIQLFVLVLNYVSFPVLEQSQVSHKMQQTSILIPARNEAETLPETLPSVLRQPAKEVIVLEDESSDETLSILQGFKEKFHHLQIVKGKPLPQGWSGKNWACHQLSDVAQGDYLVFTDADVYWQKGTLESVMTKVVTTQAEFFSVWPRQLTKSLLERTAVGIVDVILLSGLPYLGVKYLAFSQLAAGNGQLIVWQKEAYKQLGGHETFKAEVLEDVRMAQAAKAKGLRVRLALGGHIIATRMYRSQEALLEGFSKNIVNASGNRAILVSLTILNVVVHSLSYVLVFLNSIWLVIILLSLAQRFLVLLKTKRNLLETFLHPFFPFILVRLVFRVFTQRGYTWKGRSYS